ncbi:MAG: ATP-binding cassette domain-containing protein [Oscillospiraceae bacterium]|jgi:ABC-2 type transport system ATP-binding protein|nr:ATP-binding cassette domain-containing protein [Oscillospiraceae bacterium]
MKIALQTQALTKRYGIQLALNNVNITVEKGSIYGLVGQNGAGKTTLIRCVAGLTFPTSGFVELLESQGADLPLARKRIGAIIEQPSFYPNLTARQNLNYFCKLRGIKSAAAADEALALVNLTYTGNKKFKDFSLGMKQRLGLALAMLDKPEFLFLDEPVNGLDPSGIIEIRNIIKHLAEQGITIVISSHILTELAQVATHYGFIHKGVLLKELTAQELELQTTSSVSFIINDSALAAKVLLERFGITARILSQTELVVDSGLTETGELSRALFEAGLTITGIAEQNLGLEAYYMSLIAKEGA